MGAVDDTYDDIMPSKLTISGEVRHDSRPTDPPVLPPKPDPPAPSLPPKPAQTATQGDSTLQEPSTLTEKHNEPLHHDPPLPPKPVEIDSSVQEFDVSLFTDFDESLPLPDPSIASNLNMEELTDFSLLSPPPNSFLELPCLKLPETLDLASLGIASDQVDILEVSLPEGMHKMHIYTTCMCVFY